MFILLHDLYQNLPIYINVNMIEKCYLTYYEDTKTFVTTIRTLKGALEVTEPLQEVINMIEERQREVIPVVAHGATVIK